MSIRGLGTKWIFSSSFLNGSLVLPSSVSKTTKFENIFPNKRTNLTIHQASKFWLNNFKMLPHADIKLMGLSF